MNSIKLEVLGFDSVRGFFDHVRCLYVLWALIWTPKEVRILSNVLGGVVLCNAAYLTENKSGISRDVMVTLQIKLFFQIFVHILCATTYYNRDGVSIQSLKIFKAMNMMDNSRHQSIMLHL